MKYEVKSWLQKHRGLNNLLFSYGYKNLFYLVMGIKNIFYLVWYFHSMKYEVKQPIRITNRRKITLLHPWIDDFLDWFLLNATWLHFWLCSPRPWGSGSVPQPRTFPIVPSRSGGSGGILSKSVGAWDGAILKQKSFWTFFFNFFLALILMIFLHTFQFFS